MIVIIHFAMLVQALLMTKLGNDAAVFYRHAQLGPFGGGSDVNSHDFIVKPNSGLSCLMVEVSKSHTHKW